MLSGARTPLQVIFDVQLVRHTALAIAAAGESTGTGMWCAPCHRSPDARRTYLHHRDHACSFRTDELTMRARMYLPYAALGAGADRALFEVKTPAAANVTLDLELGA